MPMPRMRSQRVHPPGLIERLLDRLRGRDQLLVRAGEEAPLLLLSYPRGDANPARELERAWSHTLGALGEETRASYQPLLGSLPAIIVVVLRPRNPCGCLGHHHPPGTESRLTRRLAADLGSATGEVDVAYEAIRDWKPQPLSALAAGGAGVRLEAVHFQAALLAVLLHELEHLRFPERTEAEIRARSNAFYTAAMRDLVAEEWGADYGMATPPRT